MYHLKYDAVPAGSTFRIADMLDVLFLKTEEKSRAVALTAGSRTRRGQLVMFGKGEEVIAQDVTSAYAAVTFQPEGVWDGQTQLQFSEFGEATQFPAYAGLFYYDQGRADSDCGLYLSKSGKSFRGTKEAMSLIAHVEKTRFVNVGSWDTHMSLARWARCKEDGETVRVFEVPQVGPGFAQ